MVLVSCQLASLCMRTNRRLVSSSGESHKLVLSVVGLYDSRWEPFWASSRITWDVVMISGDVSD